jgi:glucose-1-phosphate cytidylyltransferase
MKVVLLAGGLGTRISEESILRPKPMIEIGQKPLLWHIMKGYSVHGLNDFVICCGYKGYVIKEYFANYFLHNSDVTFDLKNNKVQVHHANAEPWQVTLVDTGENTMTGGRLKRVEKFLDNEDFCMTYGDGVSDVHIGKLIEHHKSNQKKATVVAVRPPGRFGVLEIENNSVKRFTEKPVGGTGFINGGFFVLKRSVLDYLSKDSDVWEKEPLEKLAAEGQLGSFYHDGFWQPVDTLRDKNQLEELWKSGKAPWQRWW